MLKREGLAEEMAADAWKEFSHWYGIRCKKVSDVGFAVTIALRTSHLQAVFSALEFCCCVSV